MAAAEEEEEGDDLKDPLLPTSSFTSSPSSSFTTQTTTIRRSRTAPALPTLSSVLGTHQNPTFATTHVSLPILLLLYLASSIAVYILAPDHFDADGTHPLVDALYFSVVTMCTIGYGDITPTSPLSKLFSVAFVLVGFGFVDILLAASVSHFLHFQEQLVLATVNTDAATYIYDAQKGRVRIRLKVGLALAAVIACIAVGAFALRWFEDLDWLDCFYLSVMSVTTVGYGDSAFRTMEGRLFASAWLLVSTLAVARAFLFLAEARVDRRHRRMAKWVLDKELNVAEFLAASMNGNGFVSKSEFIIYKLKEMGKISEQDIAPICNQFHKFDVGNCGKIKLKDLHDIHSP